MNLEEKVANDVKSIIYVLNSESPESTEDGLESDKVGNGSIVNIAARSVIEGAEGID